MSNHDYVRVLAAERQTEWTMDQLIAVKDERDRLAALATRLAAEVHAHGLSTHWGESKCEAGAALADFHAALAGAT
jgi:hypothetical protein